LGRRRDHRGNCWYRRRRVARVIRSSLQQGSCSLQSRQLQRRRDGFRRLWRGFCSLGICSLGVSSPGVCFFLGHSAPTFYVNSLAGRGTRSTKLDRFLAAPSLNL
jgi:hypothetical protein